MKPFDDPPLRCFVVVAVTSFAVCSCLSPDRRRVSEMYGVSTEKRSFIEGKWCNASKTARDPTLWERLTSDLERSSRNEITSDDSVVTLEMLDDRTLQATLSTNGVNTSSRTFKTKPCESWLELPTQHIAHPILWYAFWGWETRDIALGIEANGDLLVNTIGNAVFAILIMPTPIGNGGGSGTVYLYERARETEDRANAALTPEP